MNEIRSSTLLTRRSYVDIPSDHAFFRGVARASGWRWRADYRRIYKFRRDHKRWPNIFRPRTFNEKILYRSIFDRRPIFQTLSDKLAVRSYVKGRVGNLAYIPRVLFQTRCADDLLTATLPYCFVLKSNHGQAHTDRHSAGEPDRTRLVAIAETWLAWDNYEQRDQWCYKDIPKTIFVEEHLTAGGPEPPDYKFFCFDGIPRFIEFKGQNAHQDRDAIFMTATGGPLRRLLSTRKRTCSSAPAQSLTR